MNGEQIAKIIELLESARKRAPMYIGKYDEDAAKHFCTGVALTCWALGENRHEQLRSQVVQERGWNTSTPFHFSVEMKRRGLTQQAMVEELFDVEIETWRRLAQKVDAGEVQL